MDLEKIRKQAQKQWKRENAEKEEEKINKEEEKIVPLVDFSKQVEVKPQ